MSCLKLSCAAMRDHAQGEKENEENGRDKWPVSFRCCMDAYDTTDEELALVCCIALSLICSFVRQYFF